MDMKKKILVLGGTGYLGQHLLVRFSEEIKHQQQKYELAFTHYSTPPQSLLNEISPSIAFHVDLQTGQGLDSIATTFGQPDVIVNCAALSVPRVCETDPTAAMAINVPSSVVKWLSNFGDSVLLIHLSTDQGCCNSCKLSKCVKLESNKVADVTLCLKLHANQSNPMPAYLVFNYGMDSKKVAIHTFLGGVKSCRPAFVSVYEGAKSFYKEEDEAFPVNVYGKSKVAAEQFISANCSNYAILRSSIIYGPQTISPIVKSLPIQWIDSVLLKGAEVEFFHDEFRCPVFVKDVVDVILTLSKKWISDKEQMKLLLNVGGPDRLSRLQMAEAVATVKGYDTSLLKPVSASSVNRGVNSPADISMDISKLSQTLGIKPTPYLDGVRLTLDATAHS
ncbi:hypothetical protein C5167_004781 [Papaver somniferum]|uniref:RmlD-like substrate binding domain-containing protein n=1 Tax=Papaver somniferum TaxID=3469 RepID=A0A4Y7JBP3_PAPSO|nr:hypothetical protein C5167_004781 [Papaver somniferum]